MHWRIGALALYAESIQRIAIGYTAGRYAGRCFFIYLLLKSCKNRPVYASDAAYWAFMPVRHITVSASQYRHIRPMSIYLFIIKIMKTYMRVYRPFTPIRHIGVNGRYTDTPYRPADVLTYIQTDNFLGIRLYK